MPIDPTSDYAQALRLMSVALASEYGLAIGTNNPNAALRLFAKVIEDDRTFIDFVAVTSRTNPDGEIWLIRKE